MDSLCRRERGGIKTVINLAHMLRPASGFYNRYTREGHAARVKGKLQLLATENLIIEHRAVETAQFDVVRRVLTLLSGFRSVDVYDLLVAHEVGHALFTDPRDWSKEDKWKGVPQNFVNITEDARIEKLMKRKYAGLSKSFYRGYSDLHDEDFFDLVDEDLDTFSLIGSICTLNLGLV